MLQRFFEYKLSTENYTKYYYLVLRFDEKTLMGLANGKFEGLKGISDNIKIIDAFFDVRELMLVMEKSKTNELNKIEPFKYYDIDFLVKDNFKNFKRVLQDEDDYPIEMMLYQSFRKCDRFLGEFSSINKSQNHDYIKLRRIIASAKYQELWKILDNKAYEVIEKIKTVKDFNDFISQFMYQMKKVEKFWNKIQFIEYNKEMIENCFKFLIINHASLFEKEGEFLIKSEDFIIPIDSILLCKDDLFTVDYDSDKNIALMNKYLDKIKEKIKFKVLPYSRGNIISNTHKTALSLIRYLDKIKKFNEW